MNGIKRIVYKFYKKSSFLQWLYKESFLKGCFQLVIVVKDFFYWKFKALFEYVTTIPRLLGYKDIRLQKLYNLKEKYSGKRCFIVCTGPSLRIEDLEKLKDEYVFGMNSLCLIHDKTNWRPDFFGIQDDAVFNRVKNNIINKDNGLVFAPLSYKKAYNTPDDWVYFPIIGSYHLWEAYQLKKYFSRFSDDCYVRVYDGYTITYSLIEIAIYMGFDEIYLLGADCSYNGNKLHFIEHGQIPNNLDIATQRLMVSYTKVRQYAESHGIQIYNATRGGCLEIFKRVSFDEIITTNYKNKKS